MPKNETSPLEEFMLKNECLLTAENDENCIELISSGSHINSPFYYYRGVSSAQYSLLTSLDRAFENKSKSRGRWLEQYLIESFKKIAHNHLPVTIKPTSMFQWLSIMQHHGMPTRLLDVTHSPFIALYFAVRDWTTDIDAALWAFNPTSLHEVALHRLKNAGFPHKISLHSIFHLPEFVNDNYFCEAFLTEKYPIIAVLEPEWTDLRMYSQQGAFMISGSIATCFEAVLTDVVMDESYMDPKKAEFLKQNTKNWSVVKLVIPHVLKRRVFQKLRQMNIHAGTLFPGLEGTAQSVAELVSNDQWTDMTWRQC